MANYNITRTDGTAVTVQEGQISSTFSLDLLGQNSPAYGASVATNTLRHLENFANTTPPGGVLLTGQLWYNKSDDTMRIYDGANWKRTSSVPFSSTPISDFLVPGTSFYDSVRNSLKVYNGVSFRDAVVPGGTVTAEYAGNVTASGNATNYGAKVETIFLTASNATIIPVVAVKYVSDATSGYAGITPDPEHNNASATVMAVFSEREFTIAATDPNYPELSDSFDGTIVRGLNLRNDYTSSFVSQSATAASADQANALFTGVVIPAADFIHVGRGYVPSVTSTFALGSGTNRFSHLFTDTITVGNPATPQTMNILGTLNVGNASNSINQLFVNDVTISGNISFATGQDVGSSGNPVENLFATNITLTRGTISTTPSANTDIANKLYVDNALSLGTAGQITVTNTGSATHFLTFVDTASGSENIRANTNLTYNAATNTITASTFSGAHVGNGAGLTNLNAANVSTGTLSVARGGTGVTTSTGTGNVVLSNSPTLVTPALGTPSSGTLTNATGLPIVAGTTGTLSVARGGTGTSTPALVAGTNITISGSWPNQTINSTASGTVTSVGGTGTVNGLTLTGTVTSAGNLTLGGTLAIAATQITSGTLAVARGGTGVTTSTGTGNVVLSNSPTLVTPALGTPSSGTLTNATGLPIVAGTTGTLSVARGGTGVTTSTGTGNVVLSNSPTLVTPALGTPSSGNIANTTGLPIVAGTTGTLSVARGGTGTSTPALVAGTNITISGSWPNQTINSTASGGGSGTVTSVGGTGTVNGLTLTGTVTTSGNLTLGGTLAIAATQVTSGTLAVARGGTGQTTYTNGEILIGNTTGNTLAKSTLTAGTGISVTNGAGAITIAARNSNVVDLGNVSGTVNLDFTSGVIKVRLVGNTTFAFTNVPTNGIVAGITLYITQDGTGNRNITWPAAAKYAGGVEPPRTGTANSLDIWSLLTVDGGSIVLTSLSVKDVK